MLFILLLIYIIFDLSRSPKTVDFSKNARYLNKTNNVIFEEIMRYETESVMMRTDVNIRLMIPHTELDKRYEKLDN